MHKSGTMYFDLRENSFLNDGINPNEMIANTNISPSLTNIIESGENTVVNCFPKDVNVDPASTITINASHPTAFDCALERLEAKGLSTIWAIVCIFKGIIAFLTKMGKSGIIWV